jgi:hypothetical protein
MLSLNNSRFHLAPEGQAVAALLPATGAHAARGAAASVASPGTGRAGDATGAPMARSNSSGAAGAAYLPGLHELDLSYLRLHPPDRPIVLAWACHLRWLRVLHAASCGLGPALPEELPDSLEVGRVRLGPGGGLVAEGPGRVTTLGHASRHVQAHWQQDERDPMLLSCAPLIILQHPGL